jgi:hypothetical protein
MLVSSFIFVGCGRYGSSHRDLAVEQLRPKLIGEWVCSVGAVQMLSLRTIVRSNGTYSTRETTTNRTGAVLHVVQIDGFFCLTNGTVVSTMTNSTDAGTQLPQVLAPQQILHVDEHDMVLLDRKGTEWHFHKVER